MYRFYGSSNSRYFLVEHNRAITLYHEERMLWTTELPEGEFQIIGVGNNGCAALLLNKEIYIFRPGERAVGEVLKKFSPETVGKTSSRLNDIFVLDQEGSSLAYCRITQKSSVSEKLFGALASVRAEKGLKEFEIDIYDMASKNTRNVYKIVHPAALEEYFKWSISRDFCFLVVGNPVKKGPSGVQIKYTVIEANTQKAVRSFELQDIEINKLLINAEGTILLDAFQRGVHSILIVTEGKITFNITPPPRAEILHLARGYVAFHTQDPPSLLVKSFDDRELSRTSLEKLKQLGMDYGLLFNVRDTINFLYFREDHLTVSGAELSTFLTEVKRAELTKQQKFTFSEASVEPDTYGSQEQDYFYPFVMEQRGAASRKTPESIELSARMEEPSQAPVREEPAQKLPQKEPLQAISLPKDSPSSPVRAKAEKQHPPPSVDKPLPENIPDKTELYQTLENIKLQLVMGLIEDDEYQAKKGEIERMIKLREAPALPTSLKQEEKKLSSKEHEHADPEIQKIMKLLDSLEERFMLGEINEESYKELKAKYQRSIAAKKYQASPSQTSRGSIPGPDD